MVLISGDEVRSWKQTVLGLGLAVLGVLVCVDSAFAAIAFRAASSAAARTATINYRAVGNVASATSGNVTVPLPAVALGELFLCQVESHDNVAHSMPAGWTMVYSLNVSATHRASLFWKISAATETNPVVTHPGGGNIIARCSRWRGVDSANPIDAGFAAVYAASSTTVATGSLTTISDGTMLLFAANLASNPGTLSTPTGWTRPYYSTTTNAGIGLYYRAQATVASVGPYTATASAAMENHGILLALRPAASLTISLPAGTVSGDVLVAAIATTPSTIPITPPIGWTPVQSRQQPAATSSVVATYLLLAGASEPASYTWTLANNHAGAVGGVLAYSGVNNATPLDVSASAATPSSTSHAAPGVTTTQAGDMLVTVHEYASGRTWTPPAGMNERIDIPSRTNNNAGVTLEMNDQLLVAAGATGTRTASASASADAGATVTIALRPALVFLHHLRIEHDGNASTCAPEPLTIKACANAACTPPHFVASDVIGINLSPTGAGYTWVPASAVSILAASGGINNAITLARSSSGTAVLGFTGTPTPAPTNAAECYNTATTTSGDCNLVFGNNTFTYNVLDHVAATRQVVTVTSCTSGFAGTNRTVRFWSNYVNPTTGTLQGGVVAGTGNADCSTGYVALGTSLATATSLSLAFGAGAAPQATFSLCYPDVGEVRLDSRYDGSNANTPKDNGVVILGSDSFVARPDRFTVANIKRTSDNFANPAAAAAGDPVFLAAGDATDPATRFTATITARNARGVATPNYGLETPAQGIAVAPQLVAPAGGNLGSLTCKGSTVSCLIPGGVANFTAGATTVTDLAWNEAGIVQLLPTSDDGDYLGSGEIATPTLSGNVGRFIPAQFTTDPVSSGAFLPPCGNFAYSGQNFGYDPLDQPTLTVTAKSSAASGGSVTQNYRGAFVKLIDPATQIALGAVTSDASNLGRDGTTLLAVDRTAAAPVLVANDDGTLTMTLENDLFAYRHNSNAMVAPVTSDLQLAITNIMDSDGVSASDLPATLAPAGIEIRFGRMALRPAYGSELLPLTIPLRVEHYGVNGFTLNGDDSCSSYTAATATLANYRDQLSAGETVISGGPATVIAGVANPLVPLALSAPGSGNDGSVDVSLAPASWLLFDWDGNGVHDNPPMARATFGIYKGPPRLIYRRETLP